MNGFNHKLLAGVRKGNNWTLRDVVMRLHDVGLEVTESTILNWEEGHTIPDADKVTTLCKVFGITTKELLS